jgi:hypothetical protein
MLMEEHKLWYLQLLLLRGNESSVERCMKAVRELEGRARRYHAKTISLTIDEFIEMLLLDRCFIIELFRKFTKKDLRDECDPIFQFGWMFCSLTRDLMLFKNQIPFFVLTKLLEVTVVSNKQDNLIDLAMLLLLLLFFFFLFFFFYFFYFIEFHY